MSFLGEQFSLPALKYVQIQTQSRCNADCVFCPYIESWHHENPGLMSEQLFDKILSDLKPFSSSLEKICPYLMQEPLLDKKIMERIRKIYAAFPGVEVEVSTNMAALTAQKCDELIDVLQGRNHSVWISHHGIDKGTLEHVMKIDYDLALENTIRFLKRSAGRIRTLIRGLGSSRDGAIYYFGAEAYQAYWAELLKSNEIISHNISIDSFSFHDRAGTIYRIERAANRNNHGVVRQIGPQNPFHCERVDEWLHVLYDGTIRLCCMDYHGEVSLPNLNQMSISEYLASAAYNDIANAVTGRTESAANFICKRCTSPGG